VFLQYGLGNAFLSNFGLTILLFREDRNSKMLSFASDPLALRLSGALGRRAGGWGRGRTRGATVPAAGATRPLAILESHRRPVPSVFVDGGGGGWDGSQPAPPPKRLGNDVRLRSALPPCPDFLQPGGGGLIQTSIYDPGFFLRPGGVRPGPTQGRSGVTPPLGGGEGPGDPKK